MSDYDDDGSYGASYKPDAELDPNATDDFEVNLASELGDDTLSSVTWVLPDGLRVVSSSNTATAATVFLTGATACTRYRAICRYTTALGRTRDKTVVILGKEQ